MLSYKDGSKDYYDYKLYYLEHPIIMKFNNRVRIFKCNSTSMRVGVTNMNKADKTVLQNPLRNVSGSLPTTVKTVRKVFEDKVDAESSETLFININP